MLFDAIVHAPQLRLGARVNIAEADQEEKSERPILTVGAELRLRIGVCAPDRAYGRIIDCTAEPESVVLEVGDMSWRLRRSEVGGIATPGLISDTWFVVSAIGGTASLGDHSPEYSVTEGLTLPLQAL